MKTINSLKILKLMPVIGLSLLLTLAGCHKEDFFELKAPPETAWRTVDDMEMGISNAYRLTLWPTITALTSDFWNNTTSWNHMPYVHMGQSDLVRELAPTNSFFSRDFDSRFDNNSVGIYMKFGTLYQTILACNLMLEFIEGDPFPKATQVEKINISRLKGEALFLRAMAYYHLLIWHTPAYDLNGANDDRILPLRLTTPKTMDAALDNAPVPTKDIYEQVVKDYTEAKALLPLKWEPGMHPAYRFGRATKHAAGAFLARTLLQMGRYDEALNELNEVLDDSSMPRTLTNNPLANFENNSATEPWTDPEIIWYGFYADMLLTHNFRHPLPYHWSSTLYFPRKDDWRQWTVFSINNKTLIRCGMMDKDVSTKVPDGWKNDKRFDFFHIYEGYNNRLPESLRWNLRWLVNRGYEGRVGLVDPVYVCKKYYRVPSKENATTEPHQNLPIIRSAELYLWRAALKQVTGIGGQAADLNIVCRRAWDTAKSGPYIPLTDADATWDRIDIEWIKEMSWEGDRIVWLQMFRKPIGPGFQDVPDVLPPYQGFYFPLPLTETDFLN